MSTWTIGSSGWIQEMVSSQLVIWVLHHLGWILNFQKLELTPTQDFEFIRMHSRTQEFTMALPLPKMRIKVQVSAPLALGHSSVSIKHRLLGTIQYMAPLVPRGRLHFPIQWWALTAWDQTSEDCSSRIGPNICMSQIWSSISCHGGFPRQYGLWLPLRVRDTELPLSL